MIRLLCRLLKAQSGLLRRFEIATMERDAPLGRALSSLAGGALQQLCFRSFQLHSGKLKAICDLQKLQSLTLAGPAEHPIRTSNRQLRQLALLTSLLSLSLTVYCDDPEPGLPQELTRLGALTSLKVDSRANEWLVISKGLLLGLPLLRSLHLRSVKLADNSRQDAMEISSQDAVEIFQQLEDLHIVDLFSHDAIIQALPRLPCLTSLNFFHGEPELEADVMECILACRGLSRLSLEFVRDVALPALAPGQLTCLTSLALCNRDRLRRLPPSWCLPSLQVPQHPAWPPAMSDISCLTGLKSLRLDVLGLRDVPDPVIGLSSLTALLFGINRLQTLPDGPYLRNLRRLSLYGSLCLQHIPPALCSASGLTELDLSRMNELSLEQQDLQLLQGLRGLQRLNVTELGKDGEVSVEEVVAALPHVDVEQSCMWEGSQMDFTWPP